MSKVVSESTRTYTVKDGSGTKTVTERTVKTADGKTTTYKEEKTEGNSNGSGFPSNFGNLRAGFSDNGFGDRFGNDNGAFGNGDRLSSRMPSKQSGGNTSSSAPSGGEVNIKDFRDQALKAHNERRSKHGVPPLKLSNDLNKYAQDWAEHLVKTNSFQHSNCTLNGERLGENIANKWSSAGADYTGEEATQQWYSEISKHNYSSESSSGTGHFTQVVWKDSKELGMGKAKDKSGKVIVVGSYRPAGNFIGNYTKNVFPPK